MPDTVNLFQSSWLGKPTTVDIVPNCLLDIHVYTQRLALLWAFIGEASLCREAMVKAATHNSSKGWDKWQVLSSKQTAISSSLQGQRTSSKRQKSKCKSRRMGESPVKHHLQDMTWILLTHTHICVVTYRKPAPDQACPHPTMDGGEIIVHYICI